MVACNIGFIMSYMVLFKSFLPYAIEQVTGSDLPSWCDTSRNGQMFWLALFTLVQMPLGIPRELSALRFTSAFSVVMSLFIVLVIFFECMCDRASTP